MATSQTQGGATANTAARKRGNFKLDVDDMERRLVEFRVNLDREKRRCQQAQMTDKFEKLLCDKLNEVREQTSGPLSEATNPENELRLTTLDNEGMARLRNFLTYTVAKCARIDQQDLLQEVLRQSLADTRRKRVQTQMLMPSGQAPPMEPFCLFCASSIGGGQQPPVTTTCDAAHSCPGSQAQEASNLAPQPLCAPPANSNQHHQQQANKDNDPHLPQMYIPQVNLVVPNSNQEVTPPPSAVATPEVGEQASCSSNNNNNDNTNTNASRQQQQQQQQPRQVPLPLARVSQLSTASSFVMPSDDCDSSSDSDSDADSIRNVLSSLNRSAHQHQQQHQHQGTSTSEQVGADVSGELVIDESPCKSPLDRKRSPPVEEKEADASQLYSFFEGDDDDDDDDTDEEDEEPPKVKLSHSHKLAKSLKRRKRNGLKSGGGGSSSEQQAEPSFPSVRSLFSPHHHHRHSVGSRRAGRRPKRS